MSVSWRVTHNTSRRDDGTTLGIALYWRARSDEERFFDLFDLTPLSRWLWAQSPDGLWIKARSHASLLLISFLPPARPAVAGAQVRTSGPSHLATAKVPLMMSWTASRHSTSLRRSWRKSLGEMRRRRRPQWPVALASHARPLACVRTRTSEKAPPRALIAPDCSLASANARRGPFTPPLRLARCLVRRRLRLRHRNSRQPRQPSAACGTNGTRGWSARLHFIAHRRRHQARSRRPFSRGRCCSGHRALLLPRPPLAV